jgi:hypothetical protein
LIKRNKKVLNLVEVIICVFVVGRKLKYKNSTSYSFMGERMSVLDLS